MGSVRPHLQRHNLGCPRSRLHRPRMHRDGQSLGSCLKALRLCTCKTSPMRGITVPVPRIALSEPEPWESLKSCDTIVATHHKWLAIFK